MVSLALSILIGFAPAQEGALALNIGSTKNISNSDGSSTAPRLVTDGNSIFVVFADDSSGTASTMLTYNLDGGGNFSESVLYSVDTHNSGNPLVVASDGMVYLVWVDSDLGLGDIFFRKATVETDGTLILENPVNISNTTDPSANPQIAISGNNVYIVWEEDIGAGAGYLEIFFAASRDGGNSFGPPENLTESPTIASMNAQIIALDDIIYLTWIEFDFETTSIGDVFFSKTVVNNTTELVSVLNLSENLDGFASAPKLSVSGTNVYVVWTDAVFSDVFYAVSFDGGDNFDVPADTADNNISDSAASVTVDVISSDNAIYVIWADTSQGNGDILFTKGTADGGSVSFDPIKNISNDEGFSISPDFVVVGLNIFVVWEDDDSDEILASVSTDGGNIFGTSVNLSSNPGLSTLPQVASADNRTYVTWADEELGNLEIFFRTIFDTGPPSISIEAVDDSSPRWGIDPVGISGIVNANTSDIIIIDWSDGTTETTSFSGNSWGPASHTYDSDNTGQKEIFVRLLDEFDVEKSSDTIEITVQKHATTLTIDPIFSVLQGNDITVTGTLTDADTSLPLENKQITFNGTGSVNLPSTTTAAAGSYSSTAASPSLVAELLKVQAGFAGDGAYEPSSSNIVAYDTISSDSAVFDVPVGASVGPIDLTGFNTSIAFDNVVSPGLVFVSACESPPSTRYLTMIDDLCLKVSSNVTLGFGSFAHITASFSGRTLPPDHSLNEIDIFREGLSGIVDITESRDVNRGTVTGRTSDFSKFIIAVALHEPAAEGATRQQVFLGDNDLLFEFPEADVSLDGDSFSASDTVVLSVTDVNRNLDDSAAETITAKVISTSDPAGITLTLTETGHNTSVFVGEFSVTDEPSSVSAAQLHVEDNDEVRALYDDITKPPFRVFIEGVTEAGVAELVDFNALLDVNFRPVSNGYELRLVDAGLSDDARLIITMSYDNLILSDQEFAATQMYLMNGPRDCLADITSTEASARDPVGKTLEGITTEVGKYTMALVAANPPGQCPPPGGGGGGLPRPGTGVVLDDVADVEAGAGGGRSGGGGGGGGGARSTGITQAPSGTDVEASITTESGAVTLSFESVDPRSGSLKVESRRLTSVGDIFDGIAVMLQDNDEHGILRLNGATYSTAGPIFDIDASEINYQGAVEVTIPYDERTVILLSGAESDVRFLHYNDETGLWEDTTSSVDELANTVTGVMNSLSPVVAAVIASQGITFGEEYFTENPLARMEVTSPSFAISGQTGEVTVTVTVTNVQRINEEYVIVTQIVDENNVAQYIEWHAGSAASGQNAAASINWMPMEKGSYSVMIFVLTELDNPELLSKAVVADVDI